MQIEFPNELEIVMTRQFAAPPELVFAVLTEPAHVRPTMASFGERVDECSIDLRVGGDYHFEFTPDGGNPCSFRGTYLEVDSPHRTVQTWRFEGWPGVEAVETHELHDAGDGATTMIWKLAFRDRAGRARMTKFDGPEAHLDTLDKYLRSLPR
ncbi:MAG TPA: SRPBCC domain-containing protein [Kofleriaceae bacterium]|jgi:uncharacterized protein YndB with AHSA1/START domain